MSPLSLGRFLLLASLATACAAETASTESEGATASSIIGGTSASAYKEAALIGGNGFLCSGSIIAPRVALTAGHCAHGGRFTVTTPYAGNQSARGTRTWTDYVATGETVNPSTLDVAVIILDTPITLAAYPKLASAPVADGTTAVNVGRIKDGSTSFSALFVGHDVALTDGAPRFPLAYRSEDIIQSGDSGGPVYSGTGDDRVIIGVNSGAGGNFQVLARVDLAYAKLQELIAANP